MWNGHLQTIFPALFRRVTVPYVRERIETPDNDFLDLDWAYSTHSRSNSLVVLSHGLEGSSTSTYLAGMVRHLTQSGFDCLAWHYRSCSGELNRQQRFYHIGETDDLHLVLQHALTKGYQAIHLVGFSAGGNVTLKYLGEQGTALTGASGRPVSPGHDAVHPAIRRAVVFSVPLDLIGATRRLEQWDSLIYNYRFNRTLKRKVLQKAAVMPGVFSTEKVVKSRSVREFDDLFTAPMNGFRNVTDYYTQSSSLQFVPKIAVPTLVINAKNDPFLSPECFPEELARELPNVWMEFPEQGGHCGFPPKRGGLNGGGARFPAGTYGAYWSEQRTVAFLSQAAEFGDNALPTASTDYNEPT